MLNETLFLIQKELKLEWRSKYTLGGILLYVVSTIFVVYLSFKQVIEIPVWNALYWVIMLFASLNAVTKSFSYETQGRKLYLYTLASPQSIILSKIIYNAILISVLAMLSYLIFSLVLGNLVDDQLMFLLSMILGAIGFSSTLTLVSAIASQTNNNLTLMGVLGFPVILPLLTVLVKLSKNAMDGLAWDVNFKYIIVLGTLNLIVVLLSYLLFPYLWRE